MTCASGKLKTEFTSPIAKSTSPELSDTTFFAHCHNHHNINNNDNDDDNVDVSRISPNLIIQLYVYLLHLPEHNNF